MSDTSHDTAALQQILTATDPDPAGMYGLVMDHYLDTDAIEALCDHAKSSVPLQVAVYAGMFHSTALQATELMNKRISKKDWDAAWRFKAQVDTSVAAQFAHVDETDLLEGLRTARNGLPAGTPSMLDWVSRWFASHAPLEALPDRVIAEMAWRFVEPFCPELGAGPLPDFDAEEGRIWIHWLMSCYLYNRFGEHGPSWDVFRQVHRPSQTIGETADTVAYLHTRFGTRTGPSTMFMGIHDSSQLVRETADLVVAVEHA